MQDWAGITAAAQVGGWVVYPLTLLAVLAMAIVIDRAYVFVRFASQPEKTSLRCRNSTRLNAST